MSLTGEAKRGRIGAANRTVDGQSPSANTIPVTRPRGNSRYMENGPERSRKIAGLRSSQRGVL